MTLNQIIIETIKEIIHTIVAVVVLSLLCMALHPTGSMGYVIFGGAILAMVYLCIYWGTERAGKDSKHEIGN